MCCPLLTWVRIALAASSTSCWLCEGVRVSVRDAFRLEGLRWVGLTGGLRGGEASRDTPVRGGDVVEGGASKGSDSGAGSDREKGSDKELLFGPAAATVAKVGRDGDVVGASAAYPPISGPGLELGLGLGLRDGVGFWLSGRTTNFDRKRNSCSSPPYPPPPSSLLSSLLSSLFSK